MEWSWIELMTVLQAVMLTTLAATSVNPAETTNNYRQVEARGRASEHRSGQPHVRAQVSMDRTFTRQPKPQKRADYRRPSPTVDASVQRRQQQQQNGAAMPHLDWTPIVQPKESLQKDYQQRQVRKPDAVVTFVTSPPTTHYNDEPSPKNHVQHLGDESDDFRNHYPYVNASKLSEGYNNKHRNVTHITNAYGAVDELKTISNFGFREGVLENNNKTRSQNSDINNGVNGAKGQIKVSPQDVYNADGESDEEANERPPLNNGLDFQLNSRRNALHRLANTDVLLLQLQAAENNKHDGQVDGVKPFDQRTQIRYGDSRRFHSLDGESKSADVSRDYPSNTATTAAAYPLAIIDRENSNAEVYDNNIVYDKNDDAANEQRLIHNGGVDGGSVDFYRDDEDPIYVNGEVDGRGNDRHRDAIVGTSNSSKARKHEDGRKYYVNNLKVDLQDEPKNKQRVSSNRYANTNVTAAVGLEADGHVVTYERPRGHNDERGEIEPRRRQEPSVDGGRAEVSPTLPTTTSARPLRRKAQSSSQARRPAAEDDDNDDGTGGRTLYVGQKGRKPNRNDRGRITTPSDKQPSVMTTSRALVKEQDVMDDDDDYISAEEELEKVEQGGYGFGYTVLDENVGMDFGQWERREPGRTGTVTGLYRVRLPDGRTQTVKYTVSPATGYRASVTYEGVQRHPAATQPPRSVEGHDSTGAETRSTD